MLSLLINSSNYVFSAIIDIIIRNLARCCKKNVNVGFDDGCISVERTFTLRMKNACCDLYVKSSLNVGQDGTVSDILIDDSNSSINHESHYDDIHKIRCNRL